MICSFPASIFNILEYQQHITKVTAIYCILKQAWKEKKEINNFVCDSKDHKAYIVTKNNLNFVLLNFLFQRYIFICIL